MSVVLENLLVAVLVAGSAAFSAWRLLPARARLTVLDLVTPLLGGLAQAPLQRLRAKALGQLTGGCSACSAASHARVIKR
jgi:hypothetical protein